MAYILRSAYMLSRAKTLTWTRQVAISVRLALSLYKRQTQCAEIDYV